MIVADLARSLRPKILDREVITERELDGLDRAARSHIADPRNGHAPGAVLHRLGP